MANGSEKYQADRGENNGQASNSSKKVAKVAAKGAADYFTGGKGGAVVDKVADSKIGQAAINNIAKQIDKNPLLKKAASELDKKGVADAADQALSAVETAGAKGGADAAAKSNGGGINSSPDFLGKKGNSSSDPVDVDGDESTSHVDITKAFGSITINDFITGTAKYKLIAYAVGILLFFIFGYILIIAVASEENKKQSESSTGDYEYCITDNLQADELCQLHNEGKYDEWVNKFGPIAQKDYSRTGVFASITIAQAMIESAWACSHIQNNLFGIKCHGYPTCTNVNTTEVYNGVRVGIVDSFRTYPSIANSIEDHSKFLLENARYAQAGVFTARDYREQAQALSRAGYATSPTYAQSLINQIVSYNLSRFDVIVNTESSASCGGGGTTSQSGWNIRTTAPTSSDRAFTYVSSNRGQCVWYAQGRAIEIAEDLESKGKLTADETSRIRNALLNTHGNGGDWYDNTRGVFKGSSNINDVKSGSLISWKKPGGYGHVAVIEDVSNDQVTISEGWATNTTSCPTNWGCLNFNSRTMSLNEFTNFYGRYYTGNYNLSGFVYFLELEG